MIKITLETAPVIKVDNADVHKGIAAFEKDVPKAKHIVKGLVIEVSGKYQFTSLVGTILESSILAVASMPHRGATSFSSLKELITAFPEYEFYQLTQNEDDGTLSNS